MIVMNNPLEPAHRVDPPMFNGVVSFMAHPAHMETGGQSTRGQMGDNTGYEVNAQVLGSNTTHFHYVVFSRSWVILWVINMLCNTFLTCNYHRVCLKTHGYFPIRSWLSIEWISVTWCHTPWQCLNGMTHVWLGDTAYQLCKYAVPMPDTHHVYTYHSETEKRWLPFYRRLFKCIFLNQNLDSRFSEICS